VQIMRIYCRDEDVVYRQSNIITKEGARIVSISESGVIEPWIIWAEVRDKEHAIAVEQVCEGNY